MSRTNWNTQELIESASRYEALPSRQRMGGVRAAVLRRAIVGGAVTVAGSTSLLAKAAALGTTTMGSIVTFAAMGAVAGSVVVGVAATRTKPTPREPSAIVQPRATSSSAPVVKSGPGPESRALPSTDSPVSTDGLPTPAPATRAAPSAPTLQPTAIEVPRAVDDSPRGAEKASDTLPQQLEVLRRMQSDLSAHQPLRALSSFRDNQRLFAGGPLEPEARGAYIAALCQLGRDDEAKREAARLQASFPASHLAQRLAAGCGSAPSP
jgi:hypothetical protein